MLIPERFQDWLAARILFCLAWFALILLGLIVILLTMLICRCGWSEANDILADLAGRIGRGLSLPLRVVEIAAIVLLAALLVYIGTRIF